MIRDFLNKLSVDSGKFHNAWKKGFIHDGILCRTTDIPMS